MDWVALMVSGIFGGGFSAILLSPFVFNSFKGIILVIFMSLVIITSFYFGLTIN